MDENLINDPYQDQAPGALDMANPVAQQAPMSAQQLADEVYSRYGKNQNYDEQLNALNAMAATNPEDFYKARIGLFGKQMGWQQGQNTADRNSVLQKELETLLPGAREAGLTDEQINQLVGGGQDIGRGENQRRIAEEAAKGKGWVNQNIPGGWGTVAGLGALAAAPFVLPALGIGAGAGAGAAGALGAGEAAAGGLTTAELLGGAGGAFVPTAGSGASFALAPGAYTAATGLGGAAANTLGSAAGSIGQALPYTEAFDAINLANQGIGASQIESILATQGVDPFMAADIAGMASNGLSEAAIMQNLAGGYTAAELAPLGMAPASWSANAAAAGLAGKGILDKFTKGLNGLGSALGTGGGGGKGVNIQALKGTVAGGGNYAGPEQWHNIARYAEGGPIGDQDQENEEQNGYFDAQDMSFLADGGLAHDNYAHNPQFFSEGGLNSLANRFVEGPGTATSDEVPAMLSNGEYVLPAHVVKAVGDGSNKKGAKVLDDFLNTVKKHKEKHDGKVSPKQTKGALGALLERKK